MLEQTNRENQDWKKAMVLFGGLADESILDDEIRLTKQEEAQHLFHNANVLLANVNHYKKIVKAVKEENEEDSDEEYIQCAIAYVDRYDRAMRILERIDEYKTYVYIIREFYEKKRPAKSIYSELNIGKSCFYRLSERARELFRLAIFGAHTRDIEVALTLLNQMEGGDNTQK